MDGRRGTGHACLSLVHGDGLFLDADMDPLRLQPSADGLTAALRGSEVIAIREWHPSGPPPVPTDWVVDFSGATEARAARMPMALPGSPFRLRQGRQPGSGVFEDCYASAGSPTSSDRCYFDDQAGSLSQHSPQEPQYRAHGMFFGAEGEYLAIVLMAMPPRPSDPVRLWGDLQGLLILKRTTWQ